MRWQQELLFSNELKFIEINLCWFCLGSNEIEKEWSKAFSRENETTSYLYSLKRFSHNVVASSLRKLKLKEALLSYRWFDLVLACNVIIVRPKHHFRPYWFQQLLNYCKYSNDFSVSKNNRNIEQFKTKCEVLNSLLITTLAQPRKFSKPELFTAR